MRPCPRRRRRARGQALVELVLGLLVFVTALLFGIHFAELGWLSMKAQEAAGSALFDSTTRRIQRMRSPWFHDYPLLFIGPNSASVITSARYADLDGRSSRPGRRPPTSVVTQVKGVTAGCSPLPAAGGLLYFPGTPAVRGAPYLDEGPVYCGAQATLSPFRMALHFLDQGTGALFDEAHALPLDIPVCGVGRASNGRCRGRLGVLVNDWSLSTSREDEHASCRLPGTGGCTNFIYRGAIQTVWDKTGGPDLTQGNALAQEVAGNAPANANELHVSFSGIEHDYEDGLGGHTSETPYNTGGPDAHLLQGKRDTGFKCFLGVPGCV